MGWNVLYKYFWVSRTKKGLPKNGFFLYKKLGHITYIKVGETIYKSIDCKSSWKKVNDKLEIICLG